MVKAYYTFAIKYCHRLRQLCLAERPKLYMHAYLLLNPLSVANKIFKRTYKTSNLRHDYTLYFAMLNCYHRNQVNH